MPRSKKQESQGIGPPFEVGSENIFKDLGYPDAEAANLLARADLAIVIRQIIRKKGWSQRQAAKEMGVAQPRIAEIMKMKLDLYSVDTLLKYLDKLGQRVSFVVKPKTKATKPSKLKRKLAGSAVLAGDIAAASRTFS